MGRGRGRGGGGRGGKRQHSNDGGGERSVRPRTDAWRSASDIESNGLFEEYYKEQGVCPPEEWDAFVLALKTPLPITFRINGGGLHAARLRQKLETDFMAQFAEGEALVVDGEPAEPPHPLAWYPGKLAWQMNFSRTQLRKQPVLEALHEFMKRENETGSITRQEAVSMVPPLFMDVEPHHWVLDMCAAPGSKTFQLLEMLHAGPAPPTGLVVANDADAMRCNLLCHQTKRMCSPHLVVTHHEAQGFPLLRDLDPASPDNHVLFDRILCDVPCSGDGTMRKAPDIWHRWSTASGNGLHGLQLRIALRAFQLLRVGGRLVYSTCTFNPVEDEAVVAELLRRTAGALQLVDCSDALPGLRRMPGKQRWRVRDRQRWYDTWEEGKQGTKLDPTMFPDEASDALPLHRCMRFLPHHQNTGGFFVAVLRKVGELQGPLHPVGTDHRPTRGKERRGAGKGGNARREEGEQADGADAAAGATPQQAAQEAPAPGEAAGGDDGEALEAEGQQAEPAAAAAAAAADGEGGEEAAAQGAGAPSGGKGFWARRREEAREAEAARGLPEWGQVGVRGGGGRNREDRGGRFRGVDPIVPYTDAEHLASIRSFYGLAPACPVPEALIARSTDPRPKKLYYVGPAAKRLLLLDTRELVKIVGAGVKVLERQDSKDGLVPCLYRFAQDGVPALLPHVTRQRFHPTLDELLDLLEQRLVGLPPSHRHVAPSKEGGQAAEAPQQQEQQEEAQAAAKPDGEQAQQGGEGTPASAAAAAEKPPPQAKVSLRDEQTLEELRGVAMGCCLALLRPADVAELGLKQEQEQGAGDEGGLAAAAPLAVACWRGRGNMNVLVSKQEAAQLAEKLREQQAKAAAAKGQPAPIQLKAEGAQVKQEQLAAKVKQEQPAVAVKQEPAAAEVKQEPPTEVKEEEAVEVKQEAVAAEVKQEAAAAAEVKQEPAV